MSNQSKRAEARKRFGKVRISKYEETVCKMLQQYIKEGHPFDKKQCEAFYSGAMYGAKHPAWQVKVLCGMIGAGVSLTAVLLYIIIRFGL